MLCTYHRIGDRREDEARNCGTTLGWTLAEVENGRGPSGIAVNLCTRTGLAVFRIFVLLFPWVALG